MTVKDSSDKGGGGGGGWKQCFIFFCCCTNFFFVVVVVHLEALRLLVEPPVFNVVTVPQYFATDKGHCGL